ncbi:hypothetical protein GCM10007079_12060 [Nocardiopsis terrae]|uniref:Secreted protein n=1 Tax=Nocardiopsis terrae TaxID=372655 RepID=A0ABR9HC31_9ACTN|nr:DUF5719 family protein [Nocardiopsis terrae]MBE1456584.1 hypothetical protein [Nocardiopsis terrae]GHC76078.1 hypothetical protein GCM10007079_12060 [Nocardiopsis terrae]
MRLIVENRFALFGLVALALLALFGVAFVIRPIDAELGVTEPGTVRPELAARVCPAPHESDDDGAESSVAAFAPRVSRDDEGALWAVPLPGVPEEDEEGTGDEQDPGSDEAVDEEGPASGGEADERGELLGEEQTEPGRVWRTDTGDAAVPTALHAEGSLASGLDAAQTTVSSDGVTEVRCTEPAIGTWFALPGAADPEGVDLDALTVHLANPETFRATVSVDIYTMEGPSYSPESRGIHLGPGESTRLDVTELIQSTSSIGVHVRTSTGRVSAALLAEHSAGYSDWVPPTRAPDERQVVPGVPGGEGTRRLIVAAPGDAPVEVRVHVVAATEETEPEGEEAGEGDASGTAGDPLVLHVPPAASAWLTLESVLDGRPGTVVVEADAPVVAGVIAEDSEAEDDDMRVVETAYAASVDPLQGPLDTTAVIPDMPEGADVEVVLGALEGDARVVATPIAADGSMGDSVRAEVAAGTTHVFGTDTEGWGAPAGTDPEDGHAVRLELLEDSGPVYIARILRAGGGVSVMPVRPAPVYVELPVVRNSMTGIVP